MLTSLTPASPLAAPASASLMARLRWLGRANPSLAATGWLNLGLALLALGLLPLDHHHVTGLLVWFKPLKFSLSVLAYAWTLAWLLASLPAAAQRSVRWLSGGIALSMAVEQAAVFTQAARGTTSHYNVATGFDAAVFGLMGLFIMLNTLLTFWALYLAWRHRPLGSAGYVWGLRLGLLVFVLGSLLGGLMIHNLQHTVGAPDGGPGLPGLGWSTRAGDLRAAHFLGMHALQALPLLGAGLGRWVPRPATAALLTGAGALAYAALVAALLLRALAGQPLPGLS